MSNFEQYSGALFDLHGVIADTSKYHLQAWHQLATELGVQWTSALAQSVVGMSRSDAVTAILHAGNLDRQYSVQQQTALGDHKNERYLKLIAHMSPADVLPGVIEFLNDLQRHHFGIVLASASVNAPLEIQRMALESYFPLIVDPATLTQNKPAPDIYQQAAAMLDLSPQQCLGFEDSQTGLAALNAAGVMSIGIGEEAEIATAQVKLPNTNALSLSNIAQLIG